MKGKQKKEKGKRIVRGKKIKKEQKCIRGRGISEGEDKENVGMGLKHGSRVFCVEVKERRGVTGVTWRGNKMYYGFPGDDITADSEPHSGDTDDENAKELEYDSDATVRVTRPGCKVSEVEIP